MCGFQGVYANGIALDSPVLSICTREFYPLNIILLGGMVLTIKVRQKQYAIAKVGMASTKLETKDIWTCTGLIGVHKDKQVAFMAHLDTPYSVRGLTLLAEELEQGGYLFSDFDLFKVAGLAPAVTFIGFFLFLITVLALILCGVNDFLTCAFLAGIPLVIWGMSGLTRTYLYLQLRRLKASSASPSFCGVEDGSSWRGSCNVTFDIAHDKQPIVTVAGKKRDPAFVVEPLAKAEGSANIERSKDAETPTPS